MDDLQYLKEIKLKDILWSFKPCYKWMTFNTFAVGFIFCFPSNVF